MRVPSLQRGFVELSVAAVVDVDVDVGWVEEMWWFALPGWVWHS